MTTPLNPNVPPEALHAFQREWEPLNTALIPIEHLGNGIFACEHQKHPKNLKPVLIWDVTVDLAEQTMIPLAENIQSYNELRQTGEDPFEITLFDRRRRQRKAENELFKAIEVFNQFAKDFHQDYQVTNSSTETEENQENSTATFEHDKMSKLPRYDEWKPERFCVHDHLMGVMGYKFNRSVGHLEVTGYATRDHTNYARGSATRAMLLCLLCEWAKQSSQKGVVFVDKWYEYQPQPITVPHEIVVYARVLGIDVEPGVKKLSHTTCKSLFLQLTPFGMNTRGILEKSGLSIKACLMAQKGIWTTHQIEDLVRYCPMTSTLFDGDAQPEKPVQMEMVMAHARLAVMANISEQMIRVQAEEKNGAVKVLDADNSDNPGDPGDSDDPENYENPDDCQPVWPYYRVLSCDCDVQLCCYENGQRVEKTFAPETRLGIFSWPATSLQFKENTVKLLDKAVAMQRAFQKADPSDTPDTLCIMVPAKAIRQQPLDVEIPTGIHITLMDETLDAVGQTAWRNIQLSQRIRK